MKIMYNHTSTWPLVQLGEHVDLLTGFPFKSANYVEEETGIRLLRGDNIAQGYIRWDNAKRWPQISEHTEFELLKEDIILAMDRPWIGAGLKYAKVRDNDLPALLVQRVARLRSKGELCNEYLFYVIGNTDFANYIKSITTGSAVPHISASDIAAYQFHLPPLCVQQKIAHILSTWDRTIDLTTQLIEAKQQRKRGLMQQLLTGKKRFTSSKNWSWREIGDLFHNVTRFVSWDDEKTYSQAIVKRWSQGIDVRPALLGKQIKTKNLQVIHTGDFLISDIQASYGAMSMVDSQYDGLYVSNVYTILIPRNQNQIHIPYFNQLSRTPLMRHLVAQSSNGFKAERIRLSFVLDTFLQQKVFIPNDIDEQRKITDVLQLCDDELLLLKKKLELLKQQKQGLLQQLLTEKVRVKV